MCEPCEIRAALTLTVARVLGAAWRPFFLCLLFFTPLKNPPQWKLTLPSRPHLTEKKSKAYSQTGLKPRPVAPNSKFSLGCTHRLE